jgi:flavin-dependent dehydrogenase
MSAIAFDPICGDGSAQSVREAILAAAVIAHRGDRDALATHYHSMLTASLRRHIQISGQFYATGGDTPWWREQVALSKAMRGPHNNWRICQSRAICCAGFN